MLPNFFFRSDNNFKTKNNIGLVLKLKDKLDCNIKSLVNGRVLITYRNTVYTLR